MTREEKRLKSICYDCSEPARKGRRRCDVHLKSNVRGATKYMATDKGKRSQKRLNPWKADYMVTRKRGRGRYQYVKWNSAVRRGKIWNLSKEQYFDVVRRPCYYCGHPNNVEAGVGLDRLDNAGGYTIDNIVSCCIECNYVRGNRFTPDEMILLGEAISRIKHERAINKA